MSLGLSLVYARNCRSEITSDRRMVFLTPRAHFYAHFLCMPLLSQIRKLRSPSTRKAEQRSVASMEGEIEEKELHVTEKFVHSCKYLPSVRVDIGRYACVHGTTAAAKHCLKKLCHPVNASFVHSFKKAYKEEKGTKRAEQDNENVRVLPPKKRGRPLLLCIG